MLTCTVAPEYDEPWTRLRVTYISRERSENVTLLSRLRFSIRRRYVRPQYQAVAVHNDKSSGGESSSDPYPTSNTRLENM